VAVPVAEPIAIVGIGCRFPGADSAAAFWQLVRDGVDAVTDMPAGRFDAEAFYDPNPGTRGKIVSRQGGFLRDVDTFDPAFFNISPREAACIDPQQRLLLEVAWEAFEDAGLTKARVAGSATGVFVGMWTNEYENKMFEAVSDLDVLVTTGGGRYAASGRLSYVFDLRGPSLTVDTACSSSLVAIHLACQSLRSGESDVVLAGGVNLILEPHISIGYSRSSMLSPDARCRFGDADAAGYVRSEGVGILVLKPLSRARADGDRIHALIRGSAVNNGGQGSDVLMAPNIAGQAAMLRQAYRAAGIVPSRIGYVEAHGTGTRVGDPVELAALAEVLGEGRPLGRPCWVGSVKGNIGHAEGAAGVAGLIKTVFCLKHRLIPPSLHFSKPNPTVAWDRLPLAIPQRPEPWPAESEPALAGVSGFGITGTNAHIVLEEAPPGGPLRPRSPAARGAQAPRILPLSARTPQALRALAERWVPLLEGDDVADGLDDLCYTASVRRTHHEERVAVVGDSGRLLAEGLRAHVQGESRSGLVTGRTTASRPQVVFVFPGQGSQWLGMGRSLFATEPVFADALKLCEQALASHVSWSLLEELTADGARSQLERIDVVQPVLFAIQVALATLWRAWGVEPDAVVGHSMGEVAAAHVAGALSLSDAARIIATRSRLLRRIAGHGGMAMVELSLDEARTALAGHEDRLSVAVSNSARSTVLSGDVAALDALLVELERRGVFGRRVKVDVASHSPHVQELRADLLGGLSGLTPRRADREFHSTVTGAIEDGTGLGPEYWVRNLREPVLFHAVVERLAGDVDAFIEMSPHPVLLGPVQDTVRTTNGAGIALPSTRREEDERSVMLESLASLWTRGYPVEWARLFSEPGRVVPLPGYPWQRERFWYQAGRSVAARVPTSRHPLLATHVAAAGEPGVHLWEGTLARDDYPCLVSGSGAASSTLSVGAVLAAARDIGSGAWTLEDVRLAEVPAADADGTTVQMEFRPPSAGRLEFRALSRLAQGFTWTTLATGAIVLRDAAAVASPPAPCDPAALTSRLTAAEPSPVLDGHAPVVAELWRGPGEALARLGPGAPDERCLLHPPALGAALHGLTEMLPDVPERPGAWRPRGFRTLRVHDAATRPAWIHVTRTGESGPGDLTGDVRLLDEAGQLLLEIEGALVAAPAPAPVEDLLYEVQWVAQPPGRPGRPPRRRWVFMGASPDTVAPLVSRLHEREQHAVVLGPSGDDDLERRLAEVLDADGPAVAGVVHLGSLDIDPADSPTSPRAAGPGWSSALTAVQTLVRRSETSTPRFWIVTRGAQGAGESGVPVSLSGAALWGLGAVVTHEHPALRCTRVDLPLAGAAADLLSLADELVEDRDEDQVAVRDGRRLVARLTRVAPTAVDGGADLPVSGAGRYLISGGLGGVGLTVARWLVARGARHLALIGRREPSADAAVVLAELRAAGAEVIVARGDVGRADDVCRVLDALPGDVLLRGIVHAAGVVDPALLANLDAGRFVAIMKPKIDGALNLHAATLDRPLDFFVLFSSVSATLGVPGEGNYAAANAALEAVALRLRAAGRAVVSIAWGPWAEVGMVATRGDGGRRLATRGLGRLAPTEGTRVLEHVIATRSRPVLAMRFEPGRWSQAYRPGARCLLRDLGGGAVAAADVFAVQLRAAAPPERRARLEGWLREQVGQVLRVAPERVDPATPLKAMGLDSLRSLELRNRLEAAFGISLPATVVWNYPTVVTLAPHLESRLGLAEPEAPAVDGGAALEQMLEEIEGLSDDDVRRLLAEGDGQ
jgi:myxalamid-type polyketide synthase MxaE and MxaD